MENTILNDLNYSGALYRVRGILRCIREQKASVEEINAIERMTDDSVIVAGREVGAYARAALQVLSVRDIDINDTEATELLKMLPEECVHLLG